jgi:cytochrome P450
MVAKRLARPRDELLDVLVSAWKEGQIGDRELLGYLMGFVAAGTDTTGTSLANAFSLMAEFGYLDYVRSKLDDLETLQGVVEETLRFGTPFPVKPLFVLKDVTIGDLNIPKGSVLNAWYVAANRDIAVNGGVHQSDPRIFDPNRWPNRHLGLGYAKHYCLGGDLARLETRILLLEALRLLPDLSMDESMPFRRLAGITDNVLEAHFRFDQGAAEQMARRAQAQRSMEGVAG